MWASKRSALRASAQVPIRNILKMQQRMCNLSAHQISSIRIMQNTHHILFYWAVKVFKSKDTKIIYNNWWWEPAGWHNSYSTTWINSSLCWLCIAPVVTCGKPSHGTTNGLLAEVSYVSTPRTCPLPEGHVHLQGITLFPLTAMGISSFLYSRGRWRSTSTCNGILSVTSPCLCSKKRAEKKQNS